MLLGEFLMERNSLTPCLFCSSKLPETPRYTLDVVRDEEKARRNLDKVISGDGKWDDDYFEGQTADRYFSPFALNCEPYMYPITTHLSLYPNAKHISLHPLL